MTPQQFVKKWKDANLSERSACQQHFLDLCELLGQPKPAEVDPDGSWYTFEKGVTTTDDGKGFADVWMQARFGWEYKGKHKDLKAAYQQLNRYREALESPPLLVVCDLNRFEIHTNFTNTVKQVYAFDLDGLADPANLIRLKHVFTNPEALRPDKSPKTLTEEIAARFAALADGMTKRGVEPQQAAHFLMKLMFCMFAEDIDLLPRGLFTKTVASARQDPAKLSRALAKLFESMARGEPFGADDIYWFNGGLFADAETVDLDSKEIAALLEAAGYDWSNVEPSIFGTLFERTLDPDKRAQIGAHYTSPEDIETLIRPVMMSPLRREWNEVKARAYKLFAKVKGVARKQTGPRRTDSKERRAFDKCIEDYLGRLSSVTVLDPACGSGNFLYIALRMLLDLEKEVLTYAAEHDLPLFPRVHPHQLRGLEVNAYAHQLAQVAIWIGYLQWMSFNGFKPKLDPVLDSFENIARKDAILDLTDPDNPREPEWPEAEFIVGNPPFLGGKLLRANLGDAHVDAMFSVWHERVRPEADLCCYWFEKARALIEAKKANRAGLLATQGIRGGANRETLARIKSTGDIFFAISDRDWVLDGAHVHISMVGFDDKSEKSRVLDGSNVLTINANLTALTDVTKAVPIIGNLNQSFMGDTKGGPFEIAEEIALPMLYMPNANLRPSSDVLTPWINGISVTKRLPTTWIIDFQLFHTLDAASQFDAPFAHVKRHLEETRTSSRTTIKQWWLHERPRPEMRAALSTHERFLITPRVSKHRLFIWFWAPTLPDSALIAFAVDQDFHLGVLHSSTHSKWTASQGTQVRERQSGFRYTPTSCFETFPFPEPTADQRAAIAAAAKELHTLRNNWLNPPEWTKTEVLEFPGSVDGPWKRYVHDADKRGIGTVRYPRIVAKDADCAANLKARTLTNLYNEMPTWLKNIHSQLDATVSAAYGWPTDLSDDEILARLLQLNLKRAEQNTR